MADIEAAIDERGANIVMHHAEAELGIVHKSGVGSLGPFPTNWSANAYFTDGSVDLIPPNVIRLARFRMHYDVHFTLTIDLNSILPPIVITFPQIKIKIGKKTITIGPPPLHIYWPTIHPTVGHADVIEMTSDFTVQTHLDVNNFWHVEAVIVGVPFLQLGVGTAALLTAIGLAVSAILAPMPLFGPLAAGAVALIMATIGLAGVTGLLGNILTPFVTGLIFPIDVQPRIFTILPASSALNPAVRVKLDELSASVVGTDEDELLIQAYISPVI